MAKLNLRIRMKREEAFTLAKSLMDSTNMKKDETISIDLELDDIECDLSIGEVKK